jgi:hypothetical protein
VIGLRAGVDGRKKVAGLLAVAAAAMGLLLLPSPAAAGAQAGSLSLKVIGLPRGEAGSLLIEGPRSSGKGRVTRRLAVVRGRRLSRLPAGRYRITVKKVRLRRRHQTIERGAVATPVSSRIKLRVKPGATTKAEVKYGTILNPGIRSAGGKISDVIGDPESPSGLVMKGARGVHRGTVLSAPPSSLLPQGLLARVTSVRTSRGAQRVALTPAGIYEVAPNMSFDIPLSGAEAARVSALLKCGPDGSSFSPFARISDIHLTGGWKTAHVLFADVTNGATVELHFKASAGVDVIAGSSFSCSVSLPSVAIQGMAGPIPVYGAIKPQAKAEIASQGKVHTEGSTELTLGTSVRIPGGASPILSFGSPRFTFASEVFTGLKAGVGLTAELGIGAANAANLHLSMGNTLNFNAGPGNCSWDLDLGSFGIGGKIGPVDIDGPSTPPFYHHTLWHQGCGAPPPPPSPAPAPAPAPPAPSGPLTRATMSWDTTSDIDLYTWDSEGNVLYFGEREGIPNAQLVEDVIPSYDEYEHPAELFQETADFNRPYTFGICDYRGEGANVTLTVVDPDGTSRTFEETLYYAGDSVVITSSPLGVDYSPPWDWCHYLEEEYEYE